MMKIAPTAKLPKTALPYDLGQTLNHAARVMGDFMSPEIGSELRTIFRSVQRQLRRFGHASSHQFKRRAGSHEFVLATSFGYRVMAVLHGYPKSGKAISFERVKKIANRVNPRLPSGENVVVTEMAKPEGGSRPITNFGWIARANQSLARDLIHVASGHSKYEFARKGRGREKLMGEINNANRNGGVRALGTFDIKNCFPSMGIEAIKSVLPISTAIIKNTITIPDATSVIMKTNIISENAVRAGLPQGALSSPIVAGRVIEPCLDNVPAAFCRSYLDDITLGDRSVGEVEALLDTLAGALATQHPSSPLFEKCRAAFKIGKHADVLGYWVRPNPPKFGGGVRFSPSNKSIRRFYVRLATALLMRPYPEWGDIMEKKAYAFAASAKNWGGAKAGRENLITVFATEIEPFLDAAHKEVLAAISVEAPSDAVCSLAAKRANDLIPPTVIANGLGLMDW